MGIIGSILIGAAAGYLAGNILRGRGYGAIGNIILGIFGGLIGDFLFGIVGLGPTGLAGDLIAATVGSVILVFAFGKKRHQHDDSEDDEDYRETRKRYREAGRSRREHHRRSY